MPASVRHERVVKLARRTPRRSLARGTDRASKAVILTFGGGASMTIPRGVIPGLEREPASALEAVVLSPARDALLWPSLDADVYVPGLVERAFGSRLFAAMAGRPSKTA